MPVLAEAFLSPGLCRSLSRPGFRTAKGVPIAPEMPFSSASRFGKTNPPRFPDPQSFQSRYFLSFLSNTVTFQNT